MGVNAPARMGQLQWFCLEALRAEPRLVPPRSSPADSVTAGFLHLSARAMVPSTYSAQTVAFCASTVFVPVNADLTL